jgi:hypothetical protein
VLPGTERLRPASACAMWDADTADRRESSRENFSIGQATPPLRLRGPIYLHRDKADVIAKLLCCGELLDFIDDPAAQVDDG